MLSLYNPITKTDRKLTPRSYLERLLEDPFESIFSAMDIGMNYAKNEDGTLTISIDIPGVKAENINVEITDNFLSIKGERKTANSSYSINKSLTLPEGYDTDGIKAELKDGVLSLVLANKTPSLAKEPKKVPILTVK